MPPGSWVGPFDQATDRPEMLLKGAGHRFTVIRYEMTVVRLAPEQKERVVRLFGRRVIKADQIDHEIGESVSDLGAKLGSEHFIEQ